MANIFDPEWVLRDEPPLTGRAARVGAQAGAERLGATLYETVAASLRNGRGRITAGGDRGLNHGPVIDDVDRPRLAYEVVVQAAVGSALIPGELIAICPYLAVPVEQKRD
jgi:hypothetical protein